MSDNNRVAPPLFTAPSLDDRELSVLADIESLKSSLRFQLVEPRRWPGALRRMTFARNIHGSNTIEGYDAPLVARSRLPERAIPVLYDACHGFRVRRSTYMAALRDGGDDIADASATRDLKALVDAGLLAPQGDKRGRHYTAAKPLLDIRSRARTARPPRDDTDPFA